MVETDWGGLAWRRMPSTRRTLRNIIRSLPWGHWLGPRGIRTRRNDIGGDRGGAPLADREPGCPGTCRRGGIGVRTAQSGGAIGAGAVVARRAANVSSDRERSAAKSRHNVYPPVKFGLSPVVMPRPALRLKKRAIFNRTPPPSGALACRQGSRDHVRRRRLYLFSVKRQPFSFAYERATTLVLMAPGEVRVRK
jgi:hypothetical protein